MSVKTYVFSTHSGILDLKFNFYQNLECPTLTLTPSYVTIQDISGYFKNQNRLPWTEESARECCEIRTTIAKRRTIERKKTNMSERLPVTKQLLTTLTFNEDLFCFLFSIATFFVVTFLVATAKKNDIFIFYSFMTKGNLSA